jgi:predicted phage terminase large subunit-like protein
MATATTKHEPAETVVIGPQPGPQTEFTNSRADIVLFGGQAGGGKTWALLMEPLKYIGMAGFGAVIFRRTYTQIKSEGAMWDDAEKLYRLLEGKPKESALEWTFPAGTKIKFAHMQREDDRFAWDGAQIPFIGFDQLEHFTEKQFVYLMSRNRSMCDVKPHIRATCNPAADHWLREWVDWWIDDDGFPFYAKSGQLRWFVMQDKPVWASTPDELIARFGVGTQPRSFTFIPSRLADNRVFLDRNPEYLAQLQAQQKVDRMRLLHGNWNVRETSGEFFQRPWFEIIDAAPADGRDIRYWDRAATKAQLGREAAASWTVGLRLRRTSSGLWYVIDVIRFQGSPLEVETAILNTAKQDGRNVEIGIEGDPGQAGKAEAERYVRMLAGFNVHINYVHESKGIRAKPVSAQAEQGNVKLQRARWNDAFLTELVNFDATDKCLSDQVDALSGGFFKLNEKQRSLVW